MRSVVLGLSLLLAAGSIFPTTIVTLIPVKAKGSGPLYRFRENRKWGYLDRRGNVVIPARFDRAEDFFEQKAVASLGVKTGYIDESGRWIIEPTFARAARFNGETAVVGISDGVGIIDSSGRFVTDPQFFSIEDFSEGLAAVWKGPTGKQL